MPSGGCFWWWNLATNGCSMKKKEKFSWTDAPPNNLAPDATAQCSLTDRKYVHYDDARVSHEVFQRAVLAWPCLAKTLFFFPGPSATACYITLQNCSHQGRGSLHLRYITIATSTFPPSDLCQLASLCHGRRVEPPLACSREDSRQGAWHVPPRGGLPRRFDR
jgi:hypothetical protein